jgi:TatD DNase family protein
VERAQQAGVDRILAVGTDLTSSLTAVDLANRYEVVFAAVGIHPHEAARFDQESEEVQKLLDAPKVVSVGEIGLDYYRDRCPRDLQMSAFQAQLAWARLRNMPVCIHARDSEQDVLRELQSAPTIAVLHCFSGNLAVSRDALELGCFISFAGNVTFPKADSLREVAARVPIDRLLVETDAPFLAPQYQRGRRNEPAFVLATAKAIAELRDCSIDSLCEHISVTANDLFGWVKA